ncbi:hypothetical protein KFL_008840040 [Klebsormidium nitens]|uniref:Uncharacterized protein n=1 Tax=Klebsormidium nitens TaxID=105231 RepID=A0A1Y1IM30_KLENI|nr:hypothetical protein KFL_008840040 [Klebsormidium nitens]|eukprot:GAQ91930.1 hypothetical protein KFL_008840040 [Klebsormidium nitens]
MFTAFTTRRLSLASHEEARPTPARPCLPATSAAHSARKPPLGKASRGERCEHGAAQGPGTLMEQMADLRLLTPGKGAACADEWNRNSLRFGQEMLGTLEQQGQGALRKRRRSLGGRLQNSMTGFDEPEDMFGDLGCGQPVEAGWGKQDAGLPPLHGFFGQDSVRRSANQNPFATPRKVKKPTARRQSKPPGSQPQTVSSGPAQLTLGGGLAGDVGAVDIGGLGKVLGPEERVAWHTFAPLQRVLIVAVAAAAAANLQRADGREKGRLKRAVQARDHALALLRRQMGEALARKMAPLTEQAGTQTSPPAGPAAPPTPAAPVPQAASPKPPPPASPPQLSLGSISCATFSPSPPLPFRCASPAPLLQPAVAPPAETAPPACTVSAADARCMRDLARTLAGPTNLSASFESVVAHAVLSGGKALRESVESVTGARQRGAGRLFQEGAAASPGRDARASAAFPAGGLSAVDPNLVHLRASFDSDCGNQADMAARCAAAIARAKDAALAVLTREAAAVLAALVVVVRKAEELERAEPARPAEGAATDLADAATQPSAAGAALQTAVEGATTRLVSLQQAVSATWHSLGPAALAALKASAAGGGAAAKTWGRQLPGEQENASPSHSRHPPRGAALRASLGSCSPGLRVPPLSRSADGLPSPAGSAWSRWTGGTTPHGRHAGDAEAALPGGVAAAVRRAVEHMARQDASGHGGAAAQLMAELEHAAAKATGMEAQLAALQAQLAAVRDEDASAQVRLAAEARGLAGEVAVRDCAIGQLRRSHAVVVAAKDAELTRHRQQVAALREELQQAEALLELAWTGEPGVLGTATPGAGCNKAAELDRLWQQELSLPPCGPALPHAPPPAQPLKCTPRDACDAAPLSEPASACQASLGGTEADSSSGGPRVRDESAAAVQHSGPSLELTARDAWREEGSALGRDGKARHCDVRAPAHDSLSRKTGRNGGDAPSRKDDDGAPKRRRWI